MNCTRGSRVPGGTESVVAHLDLRVRDSRAHGMRNEMTRSHSMLPGNDGGTRRVDQAMLPLHQKPILHAHRGSISLKKHCTGRAHHARGGSSEGNQLQRGWSSRCLRVSYASALLIP